MAEKNGQGIRGTLRDLVIARTSLVYLLTDEDRRVESEIKALAAAFKPPLRTYVWSCTSGVTLDDEVVIENSALLDALDWFMNTKETAFLVLNDMHVFLKENPPVVRKLKDTIKRIDNSYKTVFMICPVMEIPRELETEISVVDVPFPSIEEIEKLLHQIISREKARDSLMQSLVPEMRDLLIKAASGQSSQQITHAFRKALTGKQAITAHEVDMMMEEKRQVVKKSGLLELYRQEMDINQLGGFSNLKKWLKLRGDIFSKDAREYGLTFPKGVLVMGISGCGKSLCVKAISAYWNLPLLRLDMGRMYDGIEGTPEECFRKVIKAAEASAPCVLWIDEIEAGIANAGQKSLGGAASRILASFLTWMQEKTASVFIGATANNIDLLPPEILRKGRFDELFYVELPYDREREDIIRIHLDRRKIPPNRFDFSTLVKCTDGFNGAEIEQGVLGAVFRAFSERREVTQTDLYICLESIVPLSTTMKEEIKRMERWAHNRAVKAGSSTA
jgi:SpoVK/Ycf46/Vps4 family AAA+-type ATPase